MRLLTQQGRTTKCPALPERADGCGSQSLRRGCLPAGYRGSEGDVDYPTMRSAMMEETKRLFTPEFINRIDEIVVFRPLKKEHILEIINVALDELLEGVKERDIKITLTEKAKEFLADKGYEPVYGARQVKRTLRKYIEDPIAEELLKGTFTDGARIRVKKKGDGLAFDEVKSKEIDTSSTPHEEAIEEN